MRLAKAERDHLTGLGETLALIGAGIVPHPSSISSLSYKLSRDKQFIRNRSPCLEIYRPATDFPIWQAAHGHNELFQRDAVMAKPAQHMITAVLYLSILLAERINAGEGLRDRPGGYIGETENVEIFKCPWRKRTGATQKAEWLVGVERENSVEDAKKFAVLLWCLSDRVVIRHPKYLLPWMPQ